VFTAFLEGHSASPLRIRFPYGPGQSSGYPAAGVVWTSGPAGLRANLNTPRIAAGPIRLARSRGWNPGPSKTPLIMDDARRPYNHGLDTAGSCSRPTPRIVRRAGRRVPPAL